MEDYYDYCKGNNGYHVVNKPRALRLLQMKPKNIITHQIYQNLYFNICHKIAKNNSIHVHVDTFVHVGVKCRIAE